jgi:hypothetical protein
MDFNEIIKADSEGTLPKYSLADLMEMRKICAVHILNKNQFMVHPCESVEREIRRKESLVSEQRAQQRHQELVSLQQQPKSRPDDHWYKKPVGIIAIGVTVFFIGFIVRAVVIHYFPQFR